MATEGSSVLYLDKNRLFFFDGEKVYKLDFPPEIVRDLDIVSEEGLVNLLFTFVDKARISPSRFILVVAQSAIFAMETFEKDPGKLEAEFQNFIGLVPFDAPLAKKYQGRNSTEMMATNGGLIHTICEALESRGFAKDAVVPSLVFGDLGVKRGFDATAGKFVLDNLALAKGKSMLEPTILPAQEPRIKITATGKSHALPYLIGGFALALVGLLVALFLRR